MSEIVFLNNSSKLYITISGVEGACRTGYHIAGTLGAVGPCRARPSCWASLWLGGNRTLDTEVTGGEMRGKEKKEGGGKARGRKRVMWEVISEKDRVRDRLQEKFN